MRLTVADLILIESLPARVQEIIKNTQKSAQLERKIEYDKGYKEGYLAGKRYRLKRALDQEELFDEIC